MNEYAIHVYTMPFFPFRSQDLMDGEDHLFMQEMEFSIPQRDTWSFVRDCSWHLLCSSLSPIQEWIACQRMPLIPGLTITIQSVVIVSVLPPKLYLFVEYGRGEIFDKRVMDI